MQECRSSKVQKIKSTSYQIIILIISILLMFVHPIHADDPNSIFKKGNQLYENGRYDEAVKEYSILLDQGLESGNLYFNLGNSYFKKGELGKAILNYERAYILIPGDSDLRSNYNYALSKIENTATQTSTPVMERISGIFSNLTLNGLTVLVFAVYVLCVLFLIAAIFIERVRRHIVITICALSIIFVSTAFSLYGRVSVLDREAIIISKNAEAKFEPIDNATTHFTLYEGMKIYVLESNGNWTKIKRPDGRSGWIKKESMETI